MRGGKPDSARHGNPLKTISMPLAHAVSSTDEKETIGDPENAIRTVGMALALPGVDPLSVVTKALGGATKDVRKALDVDPVANSIQTVGMPLGLESKSGTKGKLDNSPQGGRSTEAMTLLFVHGELETRTADAVKLSFDRGISGTNLGENSHVVYWADLFRQASEVNAVRIEKATASVRRGAGTNSVLEISHATFEKQSAIEGILDTDPSFAESIEERFRVAVISGQRIYVVVHGYSAVMLEFLDLADVFSGKEVHACIIAPPPDWQPDPSFVELFSSITLVIPEGGKGGASSPGIKVLPCLLAVSGWYEMPVTKHLENRQFQELVSGVLGRGYSDHVKSFVVAKDVALKASDVGLRQRILLELKLGEGERSLADVKARLLSELITDPVSATEAAVDVHNRYLSASLLPEQIWELKNRHTELGIAKIWTNSTKRKLTHVSAARLQLNAAWNSYNARGKAISWAVLDTGVCADHPHFSAYKNVAAVWDCTVRGQSPMVYSGGDWDGHGTHVCGIIAGQRPASAEVTTHFCTGMAPEAKLHVYKVLDDTGSGEDGYIIKALDHIADINERAGQLLIHGVNLSLGGPFDAEIFGCGHSPICRELRRLWRQGVILVIAAGNEGVVSINDLKDEDPLVLNADLSIGDPGNLEDAICVGSVHKESPMLHGVSYFSSRGPTADGRAKPDVVAPGEKILSCNAEFLSDSPDTWYVEASGTSMACPHVSGLLAAFLSVRSEYIGRPDEVKALLKRTAITLNRDIYHQGAGLPSVLEMIRQT